MKSLRFALVALLILVVVGVARANTTDPQIIIGGATGSVPVGLTFSFTLDQNGGFLMEFTNQSGVAWSSILFTTDLPTGGISTITASGTNLFTSFTIFSPGANLAPLVSILFFGLDSTHLGILPGQVFSVDMGTTGWVANATVSAAANVPEPATLALFLTGIGAFAARRRLQKWPV